MLLHPDRNPKMIVHWQIRSVLDAAFDKLWNARVYTSLNDR